MWYYAAWKAVNVSYLNILICNRDMLFPAAAAGSWFRQRDQAWPTCLKNYSSQLRGFSWIHVLILWCKPTLWQQWWIITYLWSHLHKVSPLPLWFIGIASICKQARRLPATGAAPWVQCYLLSQPKQGSPQAGTSMVFLPLPVCSWLLCSACSTGRWQLQQGSRILPQVEPSLQCHFLLLNKWLKAAGYHALSRITVE